MRCASYCTAESYDVDELLQYLHRMGFEPKSYDQVIHIHKSRAATMPSGSEGELFVFPYGCLSFWGFSEEEERHFIEELKIFEISPLLKKTIDTCSYDYGTDTHIEEAEDAIVLESADSLIKLSLSHGLTQSVKLEAFESKIAATIEKTRNLPDELARTGTISMSRKKLSKKIGVLFAERNSINLHCDILDTPEFFWRRPRYETLYRMASDYMDLAQRLDILNRRLDVIHELYTILWNELNHDHSSRLEWIIILLIVSEVIMELLKYEGVAGFLKGIASAFL